MTTRKKYSSLFIILITCIINVSAQSVLRENVCVVKPVYSPNSVTFIQKLSKEVRKDGYKIAADVLESYIKDGFGSGFIYTDEQAGKSFIITNRHVVAQADSVIIEFQHANQSTTVFRNCSIIAVDEQVDLALIELSPLATLGKGLDIQENVPEEGTEVFSAGFPGLGGKPSWQLGKGIISNNAVYDKDLMGNNNIGAIQHTAQIDPGSSGSPLLIKINDEYKIIGVNAWKVKARENANLSIPAKSLKLFFNEYAKSTNRDSKENLERRANEFPAALKRDYKAVLPYISSDYIENVSIDHFYELINAVPDSINDQIIERFNNGRPIDGVRIALAYILFKKMSVDNFQYGNLGGQSGKYADVVFSTNKKEVNSKWIFEQGEWRLQHLSNLKLTDLESQGISTRYGYSNSVKVGIDFPVSESDRWGTRYGITYEYTGWTFFTGAISVGAGSISYNPLEGWAGDEGEIEKKNFYSGSIAIGGQLPIKVSSIYIIPNLKGFIEMNTNDVSGALGYIAGVEGAYKLSPKNYLLLGVSYKYRGFNTTDEHIYTNHGTFGFHAGITW